MVDKGEGEIDLSSVRRGVKYTVGICVRWPAMNERRG